MDKPAPCKDPFNNFAELARHKKEGVDYNVIVRPVPQSNVAIVAPHGGRIEWNTESMAQGIAANDHNLYVFSGNGADAFEKLHLTSTHFDEPRCVDLVAKSDVTVTIHGCRFKEPVVYLGGMDEKLKAKLLAAFNAASIKASATGPFQALSPENICNRNRQKQGVQLEFSQGIRDNPVLRAKCVKVVRETLKA
jgi:phage replication-related protein YjqB (UPF0714/DUF867 family)